MKNRVYSNIYLLIILSALAFGCGAPLQYAYTPSKNAPVPENKNGLSIYIAPVQDSRGAINNINKIGELRSTVVNISGNELILSENPAVAVHEAMIAGFTRGGFTVAESSGKKKIEYELKTELQKFHLEIASKDRINITLYMEFKRVGSNVNICSGIVDISESRYAGVSGDSRRSIKKYISASLEKVIKKALTRTELALRDRESGQSSYGNKSFAIETRADNHQKISRGVLSITTEPERAKIYLNGIYYGLSPQRLYLKPGIYRLKITRESFLEFNHKVAVDSERETEIEEVLLKGH